MPNNGAEADEVKMRIFSTEEGFMHFRIHVFAKKT